MGNAFIQLGSQYALRKALPGANVYIVDGNTLALPSSTSEKILMKLGSLPMLGSVKGLWEKRLSNAKENEVKIPDLSDIDAVVLSGVWLSAKYLQYHKKEFMELKKRGIPLIINGGGGTFYDEKEKNAVGKLLEEIQPFALITRDEKAYAAHKDRVDLAFSGIDMGFFVSESFQCPLPMKKRAVYCFDRGPLPSNLPVTDDTIITHHVQKALRYENFRKGRVFYSELAEDYLHLYAGCSTVYSDRVHACVATLAFGNQACLLDETPRAALFDAVEAGPIRKELVKIDQEKLRSKKEQHIGNLKKVFQELGWRD